MADFPLITDWNLPTISSMGMDACGPSANAAGINMTNTAAWPTANTAFYIPFVVYNPVTAYQMSNAGTTPSGNLDVGIYDDQKNRLVSMGSTAGSGAVQAFNITDTVLYPGVYYMAMAVDNTTHITGAIAPASAGCAGAMGVLAEASAFPLPSTANWVSMTNQYIPVMAVHIRTLV